MPRLPDQPDPYDIDVDDLPPRPPPPLTWRDRADGLLAAAPPPGRLLAALVVLAVVAAIGWRLTAAAAPPPEVEIPFANQAGTAEAGPAADPAASAGGAPAPAAAPPAAGAGGGGTAGAVTSTTGPAGGEVVVHVVGAVVAPGVQRMPAGARVVDAVEAAGGAAPDADLARINLAGALEDGQQVYVLRVGEEPPLPPASPGGSGGSGAPAGDGDAASGGPVDVNRASATELEELPGVGPATAEAIISHREQNGPFASVDELIDVRGIGEAKLEQLRPLASV